MKKTLLALAIAGAAVSAQADTKLYGHVAFNLGEKSDVAGSTTNERATINSHGFSDSRFGFSFSKKLDGGLTVVANQEFGLNERQHDENGYKDVQNNLRVRRNSFGFAGDFGKVTLGFDNDVGDGVINADLAGTNLVDPLSSNSTAAVGLGVNGFDPDTGDALRYYSPKIAGVATIGAQLQEFGETELALQVNAAGFRFNAFLESRGDTDNDTATAKNENKSGFLVGYKAPIGLSITYVSSTDKGVENTADTRKHSGFKVGYATGKHAVSYSKVELDQTDKTAGRKNDEATGLAYLYSMAPGVQLWAGYKEIENYTTKNVKSDRDAFAIGGRVQF
jgi:predicted porin